MWVTEKVLIQNLEDAGYCRMDCQMFLRLPKQEQLEMLEKKRKDLLIELHKTKDRLDCLDYLRHQYQK